jgi:hypothetical protein
MHVDLPVLAIIISGISLVFTIAGFPLSIVSYCRSARFQDFDFMVRLDIDEEQEKVQLKTRSFPTAFHYEADLVNRGQKPVDITRIILDCGSKDEHKQRAHFVKSSGFTLSAGDKRRISHECSWKEIDDLRRELGLTDSLFFLRVLYKTPSGTVSEVQKPLGGFQGEMGVFMAKGAERLK